MKVKVYLTVERTIEIDKDYFVDEDLVTTNEEGEVDPDELLDAYEEELENNDDFRDEFIAEASSSEISITTKKVS